MSKERQKKELPRFIQIHALPSYTATLLNRDEEGFAKRMPVGGVTRTRISSQCQKHHWRAHTGAYSLESIGVPMGVRSRYTFEYRIVKPLVDEGLDETVVRDVTKAVMNLILGQSKKKKADAASGDSEEDGSTENGEEAGPLLKTEQLTILGLPEISFLRDRISEMVRAVPPKKKVEAFVKSRLGSTELDNLRALKCASGLDAALFGRMVTSDKLARGDAAIHVAHAYSVSGCKSEMDYFCALDDIEKEIHGQHRSGHINAAELASGIYYVYVCIDVPLLVSNLTGCSRDEYQNAEHEVAQKVIEHLVHIIATVSPGAKLGGTAPHAYAGFMLVERGQAQPRKYDHAFLKPVEADEDLFGNAIKALVGCVRDYDRMYSSAIYSVERSFACLQSAPDMKKAFGDHVSMEALARFAAGN